MQRIRLLRALSIVGLAATAIQCGGNSATPISPSQSSATSSPPVSSVTVGAAGNASMVLAPGQTRQLYALANMTDGSSMDVTNVALWQSGDPVVATVSAGGVVTAAATGQVDVKATYKQAAGSIHAEVRLAGCEASTLSAPAYSYNAFGGSASITVNAAQTDCRWTASSDVTWLPLTVDPSRSESGTFYYSVPSNNHPNPRTGHIIVAMSSGAQLVHTITQAAPVSCSYVVTPEQISITKAGSGAFTVTTTPDDCRWTATVNWTSPIFTMSAASGTATTRVSYSVNWPYTTPGTISVYIAGLSGANPSTSFSIKVTP